MLNLKDMNEGNCYSYMPELVSLVLSDTNTSIHNFTDICLSICASDENVGTNRIELDVDKFFVMDDDIWSTLFSSECVCNLQGVSPLPKVQKLRILADAMMICLRMSGKYLNSSYNCEASKQVADFLSIAVIEQSVNIGGSSDNDDLFDEMDSMFSSNKSKRNTGRGTKDDKSVGDIWKSLQEIRDLYLKSDSKIFTDDCTASKNFIELLEYVASVDIALHRVLSEEFLNNIGDIKILESILYRDTYGDLVFSESFLLNNSLTDDCISFIRKKFTVKNEDVSSTDLEVAFNKYLSYWKTSLVYITSLVVKFYYRISPVYTTTCLKNLQNERLFPIGVAVSNQNAKITRDVQFENIVLQRRFNSLCVNSDFTPDSVIGLFLIISSVSSIKLISEQVLRGMLKNADFNN